MNAALDRTIKDAAVHREVPLRRPRPSAPTSSPPMPDLSKDTVAGVVGGAAGVLVGFLLDLLLDPGSARVWVAIPLVLGIAGALKWLPLGAVLRLLWWLV
jgi:hypothetical protein